MTNVSMFIDGEWIDSKDKYLPFYNPSTGETIGEIPSGTKEDVGNAVDAASSAFAGPWANKLTPAERSNIFLRVADMVEAKLDVLANLETINTGKSIKQTKNYDLPYIVDNIRFLAGASRSLEGRAMAEYVSEGTSAVRREPIGVVAVIIPWNYPLMSIVWRAFPAMLTGNTVIVKPATYTPLTAYELTKIIVRAGLPKGVFNLVTGSGKEVGEALASHSKVEMIAFTGSTEVGRRLAELGSYTVKKVSLELGGKAPFLVFDDADINAAAEGAVVGGLVNNGQDCANSTRYYVHESVMPKFKDALKEKLSKVTLGDPLNLETDMGPLISIDQRERVEYFIEKGMAEGGSLLHGGKRPNIPGHEDGYFIEPVVMETDNENSSIVKEEIFGPFFTLLEFSSYQDVMRRSNDVIYGLSASVWTSNVTRAMNAVKDLRFGTVWVNEHVPVPSEMPWAPYKQSGHGASMSVYSLEEYTYVKHVYFDLTGKERKSWYYQVYGKSEAS